MKINPTGNQVAIEPIAQASKTTGGVDIPETAIKLLDEGKVIELGPKVDQSLFHTPIKPGDHIAYSRYSGNWLKFSKNDDNLGSEQQHNVKLVEDRDVLSVPTP